MFRQLRQRIRDWMRPRKSLKAKLAVLGHVYHEYKKAHQHTVKDVDFEVVKNHHWATSLLDQVTHDLGIDRRLSESPREYQEQGLIWLMQPTRFRLTQFAVREIKKQSRRAYVGKLIIAIATGIVFLYGLLQLIRDAVRVLSR